MTDQQANFKDSASDWIELVETIGLQLAAVLSIGMGTFAKGVEVPAWFAVGALWFILGELRR